MKTNTRHLLNAALCVAGLLAAAPAAWAAVTISTGAFASPLTGALACQSPYVANQCNYQGYDTAGNLAFSGGPAADGQASSTLPGYAAIHAAPFMNDGFYGNGKSWIAGAANAFITLDLGASQAFDQIKFGRDRLGYFADRAPGQFRIDISLDDSTYTALVANSAALGFGGSIGLGGTVKVDFTTVTARYVKLTFANDGTAIDEVEVRRIPEPGSLALLGLALAGCGLARRRPTRA